MYHARRALLAIILLIVALGVLVFVLENQQVLALSFLGWTTTPIPVSIFIVLSLIVGLLLGPFLGFIFRRKASRLSSSSGR